MILNSLLMSGHGGYVEIKEESVGLFKCCSKCKKTIPVSLFSKNRSKKDGLANWCKLCRKQYNKENREKIQAQSKQYHKENREEILNRHKQYRRRCMKKFLDYQRKYNKKNRGKKRESSRKSARKATKELRDYYVKKLLKDSYGELDPTIEMIEFKREQILIHREIKGAVNGITRTRD